MPFRLPSVLSALREVVGARSRADHRFVVLLAFSLVGLGMAVPMALVRAAQGDVMLAVLDGLIAAALLAVIINALRGGNLDRLATMAAITIVAGACLTVFLSPSGLYWAFPVVLAIGFLVGPRLSALLFLALLASLVLQAEYLAATKEPLSALLALTASALLSVLFARRTQRRHAELETMASVDALTGAHNRRALEVELDIAVSAFRRDGRAVSLVMLDLDHFKQVNDRHGHDAGDQVLQQFVNFTWQSVRRTDRLFRFGGEEFVLLMPNTDALGVELSMSHLRTALRAHLRIEDRPITVSMGGAVLRHGETAEAWLARADAALYRAKQTGRNRLEIDADEL